MKAATNNLSSAALQPRDLISRMKDYHPPLGDRSGIRLDFNENTFACSLPLEPKTCAGTARASVASDSIAHSR